MELFFHQYLHCYCSIYRKYLVVVEKNNFWKNFIFLLLYLLFLCSNSVKTIYPFDYFVNKKTKFAEDDFDAEIILVTSPHSWLLTWREISGGGSKYNDGDFFLLMEFFGKKRLGFFYQKPSLTNPPSPSETKRLRPLEGILRTSSSVNMPPVLQRMTKRSRIV